MEAWAAGGVHEREGEAEARYVRVLPLAWHAEELPSAESYRFRKGSIRSPFLPVPSFVTSPPTRLDAVADDVSLSQGLKKFEKATAIPCAAKYGQKVETANFVTSTKLDDLIRETEDAFAEVFERGDRKKAYVLLSSPSSSSRY